MTLGRLVLAAAAAVWASLASAPPSPRVVHTQYGAVRGVIDRLGAGVGLAPVEKFLGVPYATPPVNGLRFMPPITPSNWDGVRVADRASASCPQPEPPPRSAYHSVNAFNTSEDCLYLNVFYPTSGERYI